MVSFKRALCACVFVGAAAAAGAAQAQFLDLDVTASRAGQPAGRPQTLPAGTLYSTDGFNRFGEQVRGVLTPAGLTLPAYLGANPGVFLEPAESALTSNFKVVIPNLGNAQEAVSEVSDTFDVHSHCFAGPINLGVAPTVRASPVTLASGTTVGTCDRLDGSAKLNGVAFTVNAVENSTAIHLIIPSVAYDFTTPLTSHSRSASVDLLDSNFFASGKAPLLAAKLLGKPDSFVLKKGELPNEGTLITGDVTVGTTTRSFAVDTPGQLLAYALVNRDAKLADFGLDYRGSCLRAGGAVTGACSAASATVRVAGVAVTATAAANSTDIAFTVPDLNLSFTSAAASDRNDAVDQFARYARDNVDDADLTRAYARYLAQNSPSDPLVGNPFSAQGQLNRASLDLDSPSASLNETASSKEGGGKEGGGGNRARPDDPSGWMVGGRAGYLSSAGQDAEYVDGNFERGFRVLEGSRARLKVSVPFSYIHYGGKADGGDTATFGLRTALEAPLIQGRWVIEPSAAVSAFYSDNVVSSGALYSVGISSRYKIAPIGRGHIVIGNAVNYSSTLEIEAGSFASPKISNTAVRNGIAYQVPYGRFLGRQGTVRASYTYTHLFGDDILVEDYHEVSLNYGVASREASVKQVGETLRLGLNGAFGHDFTAVSLTAGYRF
jgi:hypothetical protein